MILFLAELRMNYVPAFISDKHIRYTNFMAFKNRWENKKKITFNRKNTFDF